MTAASPLVPADRVRARAWAAELADELARDGYELNDPSLAGGSAGVAILFADLHARSSAPRWAQAADDAA